MLTLIQKAESYHCLSKDEILDFLSCDEYNEQLFAVADRICSANFDNEVYLRALVEFSNYCRNNCCYCGIRAGNLKCHRYRQTKSEIVAAAISAKNKGLFTVVLQSGEDTFFDVDRMCEIIRDIKKLDMVVTLSLGEKTTEEYAEYKKSGASRYLLRIETTDSDVYEKMHPKMSLEKRKRCLCDLKILNYEVGTGSLVGLPGQTMESLAEDILFYKYLKADMVGIGPLIPHNQTPLANEQIGDILTVTKMVALTRLLLPLSNIPAVTAVETLDRALRVKILKAGANVVMINAAKKDFKEKYEIYPDKYGIKQDLAQGILSVQSELQQIGKKATGKKGNSKSFSKMAVVGLTGGIACGKSYIAGMFIEKYGKEGICLIDCDEIARDVKRHDEGVRNNLKKTFPGAFDGDALNEEKLSDIALKTSENLQKIESLLLPIIIERVKNIIFNRKKEGFKCVVIDAPLLFEKKLDSLCSLTVCVCARKEVQKERYLARKNANIEKYNLINENQIPVATKKQMAMVKLFSNNNEDAIKAVDILYESVQRSMDNEKS